MMGKRGRVAPCKGRSGKKKKRRSNCGEKMPEKGEKVNEGW